MAVGITLTQVAAPGATPIAYNATAAINWASNYAKVNDGAGISSVEAKALSVLGLIYKLNNAGGANYKTNHAGLMQDAEVFSGAISNLDAVRAQAINDWNTGNVADATLSTDIPTLMKEARDLTAKSDLQLDRMIAFLRAQMRT
jgi:hypothetical protein